MDTLTASTALKPPTSLTSTGFAPLPPKNTASIFSGINTSTPAVVGSQLAPKIDPVAVARAKSQAVFPSSMQPTSSGGISFNPALASGYGNSMPAQTPTAPQPSLSSFIGSSQQTPNGGTISSLGGQPNGYTPASSFSINTSNPVPSSALSGNYTAADLSQSHSQYSDYVNALAQAQGYSPNYVQAYQNQQQTQLQGAELNSNLYTGNNLPGDTMQYAQGATAKAQAQNTLEQTEANIALNTQQLARTGNIASAQTQLQYSPAGMTGQNAINQYNSLQQQYPNASIPEYNNQLSPELNQQIAQELVANSPAYKAQFQSTYATPGGGTGIYSKLDVGSGGFQQNSDGSYTLVPAAAAALGSANANVVQTQLGNLSNINSAINASTKTLATTQQFMNQYGLNQSGVSILSQIQNSTNKQLDKAGAIAGLNADLNGLRADYAQYLTGRNGSVAGTNDEANAAIPDTISPSQLATVVGQMQTVGQNTADALSTQVNQALSGITNNSVPTSGAGSTTGGWGSLGD